MQFLSDLFGAAGVILYFLSWAWGGPWLMNLANLLIGFSSIFEKGLKVRVLQFVLLLGAMWFTSQYQQIIPAEGFLFWLCVCVASLLHFIQLVVNAAQLVGDGFENFGKFLKEIGKLIESMRD